MSTNKHKAQKPRDDAPPGSNGRMSWIIGGVAAVALIALVAVVGLSGDPDVSTAPTSNVATEPTTSVPPEQSKAVSVEMQDFDGNTMTISDLKGRPVVVNFWATWCPACFAEMPAFEKVYQATGDSVQFLGIGLVDDLDAALSVVEETGVTYPLAQDPQGQVFAAFGGFGMPTTVFLDETGNVIEMYTGELTVAELTERIAEYFGN